METFVQLIPSYPCRLNTGRQKEIDATHFLSSHHHQSVCHSCDNRDGDMYTTALLVCHHHRNVHQAAGVVFQDKEHRWRLVG